MMTGISVLLLAIFVAFVAALPVALSHLRTQVRPRWRTGLMILVPMAVIGVVAFLWGQYSWQRGVRVIDPLAEHASDPQRSIGDLATRFAHRLESDPSQASVGNLALLARSFEATGDHARAARHYEQANVKGAFQNPDMLVAEAQARLRNPSLSEQSMTMVRARAERALAIAPTHPGAHYLAGDLALRDGKIAAAIEHFERVVEADVLAPGAQVALEGRLQEWRAEIGHEGALVEASAGIQVRVEYATGSAPAEATLFVFVREPDGAPMPLAARRIPKAELPLSVVIDDRDRLRAGPPLHTYEELEVGARWSSNGEVSGAPGDPSAVVRITPAHGASSTLRLHN
ncbi:hypothetical protein [Algiphilus sp.]|uniref:tetratricopeptide repeat protein n=2 Tax=Bacteria TaxID=2 RepID=UPI0032EE7D12